MAKLFGFLVPVSFSMVGFVVKYVYLLSKAREKKSQHIQPPASKVVIDSVDSPWPRIQVLRTSTFGGPRLGMLLGLISLSGG